MPTLDLTTKLQGCAAAQVHVLLTGRPGISKSTTATLVGRQVAETLQRPFYSIVLPEDTPVAELRGHFLPSGNGEWRWHDGPVTAAVRQGGILLLDELSHLSPEATTFLHAALDGSDITLPTGETIRKDMNLWAVATQNDDPDALRPAILDRFPVRIHLTSPPESAFLGLPEDLQKQARKDLTQKGSSLRPWYAYARLRQVMDHKQARMLVWGEKQIEAPTKMDTEIVYWTPASSGLTSSGSISLDTMKFTGMIDKLPKKHKGY